MDLNIVLLLALKIHVILWWKKNP